MSFIPEEEIKGSQSLNLAPMIDFLFLMVVFFASLAVTRVTTKETEIDLVKLDPPSQEAPKKAERKVVTITVNADGAYTWVTDIHDYKMESAEDIRNELRTQHKRGLLPKDKKDTHVLLKVDKDAKWDPVVRLIFAIREAEFKVRPVYEPEGDELS